MAKQLRRNTNQKVIGGVCAGIADYVNMDVTVVRVLAVLLAFLWGTGPLLYLILWAVMPANSDLPPAGRTQFDSAPRDNYRS